VQGTNAGRDRFLKSDARPVLLCEGGLRLALASGPSVSCDGASNRGPSCKLFLQQSAGSAHDQGRGSIADGLDLGRSFRCPCERLPEAGSSLRSTQAAA
jgi:hypothetical protein